MDSRAVRHLPRGEPPDKPIESASEDPHKKRVWRIAERIAVIGIFTILLGAALIHTRTVAVPVVAAILIGNMIGVLVRLWRSGRVSAVARGIRACGAVSRRSLPGRGRVLGAAYVLDRAVERDSDAPQRESGDLREPLRTIEAISTSLKAAAGGDKGGAIAVDVNQQSMMASVVEIATPALSQLFIFVGTLVFFIAGRVHLKRKLVVTFLTREARLTTLRILTDIEKNLGVYLYCYGHQRRARRSDRARSVGDRHAERCPVGIAVFIMNYIPFIGPIVMTIVLIGVGFLTYETLWWALAPGLIFIVLHGIEAILVTPTGGRTQAHHEPVPGVHCACLLDVRMGAGRRVHGRAATRCRDRGRQPPLSRG